MASAKKANTGSKNSLLDDAVSAIGNSGIDVGSIIDMVAGASSKKSPSKKSPSKKKDSKSDSILDILIPDKPDYPQFSEKVYWAIREKFQKSVPEKVTASTLTNATGLKADTIKSTILPALTLMGLLKDGKPTSKLKAWINDSKYEETCLSIRDAVYPDSLTKLPINTAIQQAAVLKWFVKNADVSETTAKKMAAVYMLLSAPKLKEKAAEKKTAVKKTDTAKKTDTVKKAAAPARDVKVAVKGGKATITVKLVVDEQITKKALLDELAAAGADVYKQMK